MKKEIEAILFVTAGPVDVKDLASALDTDVLKVEEVIGEMSGEYLSRGLRLIKKGTRYQLVSAPECSEIVARYLKEELRGDVSKAALEALAIVFYKQPVTRMEVEAVRGVASSEVLRQLMIRGLICEVGRKEAVGRPILYGTTMELLNHFGVSNESEIPELTHFINTENVPG